jgi:hypothetical protein
MYIEIDLLFEFQGRTIRKREHTKRLDGDQMEMIEYMHSLREKHSCSGDEVNNFSIDVKGYRYVT